MTCSPCAGAMLIFSDHVAAGGFSPSRLSAARWRYVLTVTACVYKRSRLLLMSFIGFYSPPLLHITTIKGHRQNCEQNKHKMPLGPCLSQCLSITVHCSTSGHAPPCGQTESHKLAKPLSNYPLTQITLNYSENVHTHNNVINIITGIKLCTNNYRVRPVDHM